MSTEQKSIGEIARSIISEIIDNPDKLNIEEKTGRKSVIIGISSSEKEVISQIIGRNGHTIIAIKKILERVANKRGVRCTIYVVD